LNTRFLSMLAAISDTGSLSAAARRLRVSTTTAKEQIQALERELDARLVVRQGRNLALTAAGHAILEPARIVLGQVNDMRQLAQAGTLRGTLRVGAISTALLTLFPLALRTLAAAHPEIELTAAPGTGPQLYQTIEAGEIDCAITMRPRFAMPKRFIWRPIRDEPLVLVCPEDSAEHEIEPLLRREPFIRMDRRSFSGQIVTQYLRDHRLQPRELFEMDAQEAIVVIVAQGMGVSLLPDWGIAGPVGRPIRKLAIGDARYDRTIGLLGVRGPREGLMGVFADALAVAAAAAGPGEATTR